MNRAFRSVPAELKTFEEPSCLLPGENRREFELVRQMIIEDIGPRNNIEWLWTLDLVELSWEILRYRQLKHRIVQLYRERAIEAILLRLDSPGISRESSQELQSHIKNNVADWRDDPKASAEIEARLLLHNFDVKAISAESYCQAQHAFAFFEHLVRSAQNRRIALLREVNYRREVERRIERQSEYTSLESKAPRNRRGRT